jgi:hypothetical protein
MSGIKPDLQSRKPTSLYFARLGRPDGLLVIRPDDTIERRDKRTFDPRRHLE